MAHLHPFWITQTVKIRSEAPYTLHWNKPVKGGYTIKTLNVVHFPPPSSQRIGAMGPKVVTNIKATLPVQNFKSRIFKNCSFSLWPLKISNLTYVCSHIFKAHNWRFNPVGKSIFNKAHYFCFIGTKIPSFLNLGAK